MVTHYAPRGGQVPVRTLNLFVHTNWLRSCPAPQLPIRVFTKLPTAQYA